MEAASFCGEASKRYSGQQEAAPENNYQFPYQLIKGTFQSALQADPL